MTPRKNGPLTFTDDDRDRMVRCLDSGMSPDDAGALIGASGATVTTWYRVALARRALPPVRRNRTPVLREPAPVAAVLPDDGWWPKPWVHPIRARALHGR